MRRDDLRRSEQGQGPEGMRQGAGWYFTTCEEGSSIGRGLSCVELCGMVWHGVWCTVNICTVQYQQAEGMERTSVETAAKEGATSRLPGDKRGYIATGKVRARPCEERRGEGERKFEHRQIQSVDGPAETRQAEDGEGLWDLRGSQRKTGPGEAGMVEARHCIEAQTDGHSGRRW